MRTLAAGRGYGARLRKPTTLKIKCLNVVPKAGDIGTATDGAGWGRMWSNFDWTGWIKAQIDLAVTNGANCVKVTGSGASADYPTDFLARARVFLRYCAAQKLYVYWNFASSDFGGSVAAATTPLQQLLGMLQTFPNVIGVDVANEVGGNGTYMTLTQAQGCLDVARAATFLPLTASVLCLSAATFTGTTVQALTSRVDFYDFHPYYSTGDPAAADWNTFAAASYAKPWMIGEIGSAGSSSVQTARWSAVGSVSAARTDCFGANGFCITDYDAANAYGMYAADLTTVRTQIQTPFAAWPGRR